MQRNARFWGSREALNNSFHGGRKPGLRAGNIALRPGFSIVFKNPPLPRDRIDLDCCIFGDGVLVELKRDG